MTLKEFAVMAQTQISLEWPDINGRWMARLAHTEFKQDGGGVLHGGCGRGATPEEAIQDFVRYVKEFDTAVVDAMSERRREYGIPKSLKASE